MENMNDFLNKQKKVLKKMKAVYDDNNEAAKLIEQGDDSEMDILTAMYTDYGAESDNEVLGEYFFRLLTLEDDDLAYLTGIHTIIDDESIEDEDLSALLIAINILNYYLPFGSFSMEVGGKSVIYKLVIPVSKDLSEAELYDQLDTLIGHCLHITSQFTEPLVQVSKGLMGIEEFTDFFETEE